MSTRIRLLQLLGIALVGGSAFFTTMRYQRHPQLGALRHRQYEISAGSYVVQTEQAPARVLGDALAQAFGARPRFEPLWQQRAWYPFLLVPVWLLALLLMRNGPRHRGSRRTAGLVLLALSGGIALFEAVYLHSDYASFLPPPFGAFEAILTWLLVVAVLFWRRSADRRAGAIEATVAAQALLGFLHLMTLPLTMARPWLEYYAFDKVLASLLTNFPPAFWVACAGFLLIALPVYLRRAAGPPGSR